MGAVIRTILSVLLKTVFRILLIFLLLVLFFPVIWSVDIKKHEDLSVHADISWLFRFIHVFFILEKGKEGQTLEKDIRICGISLPALFKKIKGRKKKKASRRVRTEAAKKPTIPPGGNREKPASGRLSETEIVKAKHAGFLERLGAKISALIGKFRSGIRKLRSTAGFIEKLLAYLNSESFANCRQVLTKEGMAIMRHILPYKIRGTVRFGTDDPAKTGIILGLISVFYPSLPGNLTIEPEFTESCLEADLFLKGRIVLFVLAVHGVRILLCKDVRKLIGCFLKKNKEAKVKKKHKGRGTSWQKTKKTTHFRTT